MKILVIGSKGFIGSHILSYFTTNGHETYGCDIVVDYIDPRYYQIDSTNADYTEVFRERSFDICINCSGAASVPDSIIHPKRDYELNTSNVLKMLDAIRINRPGCRFVNLSSAAVYGNPRQLPIGEDHPLQPISPYGMHKMYAEQICREYFEVFGVPVISLRIFSAYGPGLRKQLFWDLYQKCSGSDEIVLFGTGKESRDFIYIEDIASAMGLVVDKAEFNGGVLNLGNGKEVTIADALETFISAYNWQGKFTFSGEGRKGDPVNWRADISDLRKLGFEPAFNLKEGLSKFIEWSRKEG